MDIAVILLLMWKDAVMEGPLEAEREKNPVGRFANNPIYPLLSTWISTWMEPEALYE